jgi:hypothetical protein
VIRRTASSSLVANAGVALAFAGPAFGQTAAPQLRVQHVPHAPGATVFTSVEVRFRRTGPPTATAAIYAPHGYSASLPGPGTHLGHARVGFVPVVDPRANPTVGQGDVIVTDASATASDQRLRACAPGDHDAIWELELLGRLVVVDETRGGERALGSYRLKLCPSDSPVVEPAPPPSRVVSVRFTLTRVFRAPAVPGEYLWRAFVLPDGAAAPLPGAASPEVRARVPIPYRLTMRARYERARGTALLEGTLTGPRGPRAGVDVWAFRIRGGGSRWTLVVPRGRAPTRTSRAGRYRVRVRLPATAWVVAVAYPRVHSCRAPPTSSCVSEATSARAALPVRIRVPPR